MRLNDTFIGVVEDIKDPKKQNRVRVRCFEYHTENKTLIATSDLPWAKVLMGTNSASMSGLGVTPHGLLQGSWVFGVFLDDGCQIPVVMGTFASTQEAVDYSLGFTDPDQVYPKEDYLSESDVNKLARGENTVTVELDTTISEPASPFAAKYPHNKVMETESGHVIELDDTPGAERIRIRHKSGTQIELFPNGDVVSRNNNKWQVTTGNDRCHITGEVQLVIDGDANITVGGSTNLNSPNTNISGNVNIGGALNVTGAIKSDSTIDSGTVSLDTHEHPGDGGDGSGPTTGGPI